MPNWCYNTVGITGDKEKIEALRDKLGKPYEIKGETVESPLSFWNIVAPTDLVAYNEVVGFPGREIDDELGWYGWNIKNWGCKWDAIDATLEELPQIDGRIHLSYHFQTPWSPPEKIMEWLFQHGKENGFTVCWHYEEEQGWGGERELRDGELTEETWDIPSSHAEYVARNQECFCEWAAPEDAFPDCPKPEEANA